MCQSFPFKDIFFKLYIQYHCPLESKTDRVFKIISTVLYTTIHKAYLGSLSFRSVLSAWNVYRFVKFIDFSGTENCRIASNQSADGCDFHFVCSWDFRLKLMRGKIIVWVFFSLESSFVNWHNSFVNSYLNLWYPWRHCRHLYREHVEHVLLISPKKEERNFNK